MSAKEEFISNGLEAVLDAEGLDCGICCQGETSQSLVYLPCHPSHIFCLGCIHRWLKQPRVNTCPSCRTVLFDLPDNWSEHDSDADTEGGQGGDQDDEDLHNEAWAEGSEREMFDSPEFWELPVAVEAMEYPLEQRIRDAEEYFDSLDDDAFQCATERRMAVQAQQAELGRMEEDVDFELDGSEVERWSQKRDD